MAAIITSSASISGATVARSLAKDCAAFMSTHCNHCHNAGEGKRSGAPESYRFETVDDIRAHKARIFVRSAATNVTMPPGPDDPPPDDRDRLAEWLACGAP